MGSLLKLVYGPKHSYAPGEIYHVSLMSCFDRKLESSRPDFFLEGDLAREVDAVITPVEIDQIFEQQQKSLFDFDPVPLADLFCQDKVDSSQGVKMLSHSGSGSGGYSEFVLREAAREIFQKNLGTIEWIPGRYRGAY